jgi:competence protein ComEC
VDRPPDPSLNADPAQPPWLPFIALGVVVGACAPGALNVAWGTSYSPLLAWWVVGAPLAALAVACAWRWGVAARALAFAAAALLGGALAARGAGPPVETTRLLAVRGEVTSIKWQGLGQGFALGRVETVDPVGWIPPGRLFVRAPDLPGVRPGDVVEAQGVWSRDERGESLRAVAISVQPREDGSRAFAWRTIDRFAEHRELAGALLLGRGDPPERADFRSAGLAHVLAVSGMHLVIAAGLLVWLLRSLGLGWWSRLLLLGMFLAGYTWLTHASPATVRALAMSLAVITATLSWREPHRLGPVALAALVLVAWDPLIALDLGFQLSLAAVLGIVTLGVDLIEQRKRVLPLAPWPLDRPVWRLLLWSGRALADGAVIGIAATLATAPLIAWHLGQVAPWSWLTSLAAGVPATIALWAGLPLLVLAGVWPGGPWEGLYRITERSLDALAGSAAWGAQHLPQQLAAAPSALALCLWPLLFIRLRSGRDLALRVVVALLLLSVW